MNRSESLGQNHYLVTHEVGPRSDGIRLDAFLKERYRKRSREAIKRAIDAGSISVSREGKPYQTLGRLKPSFQLQGGDQVAVLSERKPEPEVTFDYQILYEDEAIMVINKPAPLPVHPAGSYFFNTLIVHLRTRGLTHALAAKREFFLVHRIDKDTSGILVLAKTKEACAHIVKQFADRETQKKYFAVVHGCPSQKEFFIDQPLARARLGLISMKMAITPLEEGGQDALTHFRVLSSNEKFSLIECIPKTGRQHQIRVHLAYAGFPIVGDKLYSLSEKDALRLIESPRVQTRPDPIEDSLEGENSELEFDFDEPQVDPSQTIEAHRNSTDHLRSLIPAEIEAKLILPRHALHAAQISFMHPLSKKKISFDSPIPKEFQDLLTDSRRLAISQNPDPLFPKVNQVGVCSI